MDTSIFLWIALILVSTKTLSIAFKRIHMPQVIGALLAGILLGPAVLGLTEPNETIAILAEFGVILMLFSAGMETDLRQLRNSLKASFFISTFSVVAVIAGAGAVAYAFGMSVLESVFIGIALASSTTSIIVESLQEIGKLKSKTGTVILSASLVDDILVIIILAVVIGMGADNVSAAAILPILLRIVGFFIFAGAVGFGVNKLFNVMYDRLGSKGRFSIFAIAYCFAMAFLAEQFGLASITGAYIAGVAFCTTRNVKSIEQKTHTLSYLLFTPIFLANIGLNTSFEGITVNILLFTAVILLVSVFAKIAGCVLGAVMNKYTIRESLQIGVAMAAKGEVSFIVMNKGALLGYVGMMLMPSIIVVVLLTVFLMPIFLKMAYGADNSEQVAN
ncbi:MAG: cation:proton antiporter [Defluviitaleaceae bacterium]|nr:cation:proton antiporter [Defluviitaleaceae bacterium]